MRPIHAQSQSLSFAVLSCSLLRRWYPRTLHLCIGCVTLCSRCFFFSDICFIFMIRLLVLFLPLHFCLPRGACVVPAPLAGQRNAWFVFELYVAVSFLFFFFSFSFPAFRLVWSCRPSVGPSPRHIIGLIVPANSNRVPSGLGLRPARMHKVFVSVFFPFCSFLFALVLPFCCPSLYTSPFQSPFSGVRMYHSCVSGLIPQQVLRDRVLQVVIVPLPLRTSTAVHVIFCLLSSFETFIVACFVTTGWISER